MILGKVRYGADWVETFRSDLRSINTKTLNHKLFSFIALIQMTNSLHCTFSGLLASKYAPSENAAIPHAAHLLHGLVPPSISY